MIVQSLKLMNRLSDLCWLALALLSSGCTLGGSHASETDGQEYGRFLTISQLQAYYYTEPKSNLRYPLVRGSLTNLGSESLDVVEFNVKFKDALNNGIYEEKVYPVFLSDLSRLGPQKPLETGQSTRFAFKFPACPSGWQPGQVNIDITKIIVHKPSNHLD